MTALIVERDTYRLTRAWMCLTKKKTSLFWRMRTRSQHPTPARWVSCDNPGSWGARRHQAPSILSAFIRVHLRFHIEWQPQITQKRIGRALLPPRAAMRRTHRRAAGMDVTPSPGASRARCTWDGPVCVVCACPGLVPGGVLRFDFLVLRHQWHHSGRARVQARRACRRRERGTPS